MIISQGEFKGKPILTFKRDENDKFPVAFGVRKCKVILEHLDEIQNFYEANKHTLKPKGEQG
jgi:hypothetical protein